MSLAEARCVPCRGGEPPLAREEIEALRREVPAWNVVERDGILRLERTFAFPDFAAALRFTNQVGELAEREGHHPALVTEWGRVTVSWWTHKIRGLHRNDFVMAAKTDRLYEEGRG
jgi:4a-hydroxytetrahydrobiopterin dehydratase